MQKFSKLQEDVMEVLSVLEDQVTSTQMDCNSRWVVRVDEQWFPVVGWNCYGFNSECSTKPIILNGRNWEEIHGECQYRFIPTKKEWKRVLAWAAQP